MMNDFCKYCTGRNKEEIINCEFTACPFWKYRAFNLPYQEQRKSEKK